MALDADILTNLMLATSGATGPQSPLIWGAYARGVVNGLKLSIANGVAVGAAGLGELKGVGAIHGGPLAMVPIVASNMLSVGMPPAPGQALFNLAISQIATHTLTALEISGPTPGTGSGAGTIPPGGYVVPGPLIAQLITVEILSAGITPTPIQPLINLAIGNSTQQIMALASTPFTVTGPAGSSPGGGPVIGIIS